jgi:hypothetical protein
VAGLAVFTTRRPAVRLAVTVALEVAEVMAPPVEEEVAPARAVLVKEPASMSAWVAV